MVRLSLKRWKYLERLSKRTLYTQTGLLVLGMEGDNFTQPSHHVLRELDMPTERLTREHCKQRFPQFASHPNDIITFNTEAGILHASTCLQTLKELIIDLGGAIYKSNRVTHIASDSQLSPVRIYTSTGSVLAAHRLLAPLHLPVRLTRQYLLYFAGLPTSSFDVNAFPAFITHDDLYGFPIHSSAVKGYGSNWLKAASHTFGPPVDPDDILPPDQQVINRVVSRLRELLPALEQADLVQVDSCMYDVTPDEDFILDRLPHDPRIVFATGLTGHGFKFGLLLGEILSSMVCNIKPPVPLERFQLARFSHQHQKVSVA